jgi:hypothetical protein
LRDDQFSQVALDLDPFHLGIERQIKINDVRRLGDRSSFGRIEPELRQLMQGVVMPDDRVANHPCSSEVR